MTFWKWSKTAATNGSADSTCPFPEGMAPSALNDGTRGMMAAAAKFRDDTSGALVTGGTSTAYTLTSNQVFSSKTLMNGAEIAFTMDATNGASPTLNVDGLGGDPITLDGTNAVPAGTLIAGSVYTAVYYFSGTAWRLKDFYQLPFTVPIGGTIDFFGTTAPNSNFVFPYGQAISRTTYSALFALTSTTFGAGDGSTTFNIPDLRGRVIAGKDDMGGSAASRMTSTYFGASGATLGSVGGAESLTLTLAQLPTGITSAQNSGFNVSVATTQTVQINAAGSMTPVGGGSSNVSFTSAATVTSTGTVAAGNVTSTSNNTSGSAHRTVQPTIIANKLLRII